MNKFIKLGKNLSLMSLFLLISCGTIPMEIIEPKINGIKTENAFSNIKYMTVDKSNNLYIVENNVIKKIDSNGNTTILGGKEKPDNYPEDTNIDEKFLFGEISDIQYVEKDSGIYFIDRFKTNKNENYCIFVRKITNNKVESILGLSSNKDEVLINKRIKDLKTIGYYFYISKKGEIYTIGDIFDQQNFDQLNLPLLKIDLNGNIINLKKLDESFDYRAEKAFLKVDNQGTMYLLKTDKYNNYEVYVMVDSKWKKIVSSIHKLNITTDNNNNLYIVEDTFEENIEYEKTSGYSPILIHKIPKEKILNLNDKFFLGKKIFFIGELSEFNGINVSNPILISDDNLIMFSFQKSSIVKININRGNK